MKNQFLLIAILMLNSISTQAQVAINTNGSTANASAALDISSSTTGLLIPRMTTAERVAITTPATGLMVYDNSTNGFWYYNGVAWTEISSATSLSDQITDADSDTKIQVEESTDEDIIRFDMAGTEFFRMSNGRFNILNTGRSVFIGEGAGANDNLNNNNNVFVGYQSGKANTTGFSNTAIGYQSLNRNTTGIRNTAIGYQSLYLNTGGAFNTAIGYQTLNGNITGDFNTAIGYYSLYKNTTGFFNTAIGYQSLYKNTTGEYNLANGVKALYNNTTGDLNTAIGRNALYGNKTGNNNTSLGYTAFSTGSAYTNSTALGYNAEPNASNTIRLGNSSVSSIGGFANWTNISDGRFKINVKENVGGLDFIMKLRPVTYTLDMDAIARFINTPDSLRLKESDRLKTQEVQSGFIAQEVEAAANEVGFSFHGVDKPKNAQSHYGLRYAEFVVPIVKAMQEQQVIIAGQKQEIESQNKLIFEMMKRLETLENYITIKE